MTLASDRSVGRLRWLLGLLFLALAVPSMVLVVQGYRQLKWESFHQHRLLAEEMTRRIDGHLVRMVQREDARPVSDYAFLGAGAASRPAQSDLPGLIGYFQVDPDGGFSTPLLPLNGGNPGFDAGEYARRLALQQRIQSVLAENRLVGRESVASADSLEAGRLGASEAALDDEYAAYPEEKDTAPSKSTALAQEAFDRLNTAPASAPQAAGNASTYLRVDDLELDESLQNRSQKMEEAQRQEVMPPAQDERRKRKEQSRVAAPESASEQREMPGKGARVRTFESEIDPLDFSLLDSGHLVLFRWVWRDNRRYVQGALMDQVAFLRETMETPFRDAALARMSDLIVAYQGNVLQAFEGRPRGDVSRSKEALRGALLYQNRLSAPLAKLELLFSIEALPAGPGARIIGWAAGILAVVLVGGFIVLYRLGARQISLSGQQQDFVSAVSHELKTPLTTIRMYGEMLREGWVDEAKKKTYYDFIYHESERLSRLINNVLQLARLSRNRQELDPKTITVAELLDLCRSKVTSQIEQAGFELTLQCADAVLAEALWVDPDCFAQILINLVDNAVKFSAKAEQKAIHIGCQRQTDGSVCFTVRDFGPGVPKDQMRKIFKLFYRPDGGLTRETAGTGIGLALVQRLTLAMAGKVDVRNRQPGAEFSVTFPIK